MARVLGLGGVFVKARDRKALIAWYRDVLGIATDDYGAMFTFADDMKAKRAAFSVWGRWMRIPPISGLPRIPS